MIQRWKLAAALIAFALCAHAQSPASQAAPEWSVDLGAGVLRNNGTTMPGWSGSISQYPYSVCPWLGGVLEADGFYHSDTVAGQSVLNESYLVMGGPSVRIYRRGLAPFARAQVGALIDRASSSRPLLFKTNDTRVAVAVGGGADLHLLDRAFVRLAADYVRAGASDGANLLRATGGLVFRF